MNVSEVMTKKVVKVEMDDRLTLVKEILDSAPFHHLLVVEDDKLQGVISERDLLRCLSPFIGTKGESAKDANTIKQRAHQVMTRSPLVIKSNVSVHDALTLMYEHTVGCLPVVDDEEIVGIFTLHDGIRVLLDK